MIIKVKSLKSILLTCMSCIAFASFAAEESINSIGVEMDDGSRLVLFFSNKPAIVFRGNEIEFRDTNHSTSVHFSDVRSYRPEYNDPAGVVSAETDDIRVYVSGGDIIIETAEKSAVDVYNSEGKIVTGAMVEPGGRFVVSNESCPPGVYLVKINDRTFKIVKP